MNYSHIRNPFGAATRFVLCIVALGLGLPAIAAADNEASNLEFIIVSDDIRKSVKEVERPGGDASPAAAPAAAPATAPAGADAGKSNNGHGNNVDGVDSSNPGQGKGGPNGGVDPSGTVDDEMKAGGGGASPSKGKKK